MESATITKVTLRKEKLRSGKLSLYLDYYPPIWNPHIKKMSRREFLGLYLIGNPKDKFELDYNEEIMLKARGIRATRELAIINEEFGFLDRTKKQADFLEYFESKTKEKYQKWEIVYKHFKDFCNGRCLMKDVTIGLCNDFRTYIDERCDHRTMQRLPHIYSQNPGETDGQHNLAQLCRRILVNVPSLAEAGIQGRLASGKCQRLS